MNLHIQRPKYDPNNEGWGSHQPVLTYLLNKIPNCRFLELGAGDNSTSLITELSSYSEHYETNFEWYQKMKKYETDIHKIIFWNQYTMYEWLNCPAFEQEWDVAFIDNAPGESRQSNLLKLRDKCRFIVCHDTEEVYKPSASNYGWNFSTFKYNFVFDKYNTYTNVLSNFEEFKMDI